MRSRFSAGKTTLENVDEATPKLAGYIEAAKRINPGLHFYWRSTTAFCNSDNPKLPQQNMSPGQGLTPCPPAPLPRSLTYSPWRARGLFSLCGVVRGVSVTDRSRHNPNIHFLNQRTEHLLCKGVSGVKTLDGFGWTKDSCDGFDDTIHHSRLAFWHVTTFLRHECGIMD